ncbi:MAG: hypothetical protein PHG08_01840 [Bacilli bacterium]|nr:hypothetical protein [Bacilli bacterium]
MKYNSELFYNVLINNYQYEEVNFSFCRALKISSMDAFRYVVFSNSGYLDLSQIENRLIIRKDYFRVFNQAEQESIQHGLFEGRNCIFKATPNLFFEKYPKILKGDKFIVFIEYNTKLKIGEPQYYPLLRNLHSRIEAEGLDPFDFIITLIPSTNNPKDLESFFEFCIVEKYRRNGFLTDSQIPFYYGVGTPDAAAYSNITINNEIFRYLNIVGATTIDLMCLRYQKLSSTPILVDDSYVFEVKTGSVDGSQIKKYKEMNIFNKAYEVIPHKNNVSDYSGLINYDDNGNEKIHESDLFDTSNRSRYYTWLSVYIKCLLVTNFTNHEFANFKKRKNINDTESLISILKKMTFKEIIDEIRGDNYAKNR